MSKKKLWWHKTGFSFQCRMCGKCCGEEPGIIRTTPLERINIAEHLNIEVSELKTKYMKRLPHSLSIKERDNYDCVFLDEETKKCRIYPVRPKQCRLFPFWKSMLEDKKEWDFYAERCPGINFGRQYTPEEIEKIYNKLP